MAAPSVSTPVWKEAFGDEERPTLYPSATSQKSRFTTITSPKKFTKDLESLSHIQLYALAENCQLALKTAQDEFLHIERLIRLLEQKDPPNKPQDLLDPDRFEEEKEATLYGYRRIARGTPYMRTRDGTEFCGFPEPFSQGGFVPTDAQYKRLKVNAKDSNNLDGWTPIERDGKKLIPRMPPSSPPRPRGFTGTLTRPSRKRRLVEQNFSDTDATAGYSDSDAFNTPSKHVTRFLGRKIPLTRDPSEMPASNRGSPTPVRHHKFIMKNLTQALLSSSTSALPSRNSTPHEASPTPSSNKKRRITQRHHEPRLSTSTNLHSSPSSYDPVEDKKWTDSTLLSAINTDHSFLHPDPEIALTWKNAIINAANPVRSYAMKRKWAWWRKGGMDKRPRRGLREGTGEVADSPESEAQEIKREDVKELKVKTEDEEIDHGLRCVKISSEDVELRHIPHNTVNAKEELGGKDVKPVISKVQEGRQFTFKLHNPPPPPPPPS